MRRASKHRVRLRALRTESEGINNNKNNGLKFLNIAAVPVILSWQASRKVLIQQISACACPVPGCCKDWGSSSALMSIIDGGSAPLAPAALVLLPVAVFHPAFEHRAQLLLLERFGEVVVHAGGDIGLAAQRAQHRGASYVARRT